MERGAKGISGGRSDGFGDGSELGPAMGGNGGAGVAHGFGANVGGEGAGGGQGPTMEVGVEEGAGKGVARTVGIDDPRGGHGGDAVELGALRDPGAVFADLDDCDHALGGEAKGEGGVVVTGIRIQGADLVLVGEDDADASLAELVDATDSKSVSGDRVSVRVRREVPN